MPINKKLLAGVAMNTHSRSPKLSPPVARVGRMIKKGDRVVLLCKFNNGAHDPKHQRFYPIGSTGVVIGPHEIYRTTHVMVAMDDPPGFTYAQKKIGILKVLVRLVSTVS